MELGFVCVRVCMCACFCHCRRCRCFPGWITCGSCTPVAWLCMYVFVVVVVEIFFSCRHSGKFDFVSFQLPLPRWTSTNSQRMKKQICRNVYAVRLVVSRVAHVLQIDPDGGVLFTLVALDIVFLLTIYICVLSSVAWVDWMPSSLMIK